MEKGENIIVSKMGKKTITHNADMNVSQLVPAVETRPRNIAVKVELMENGEYFEDDYKPKIESDLEVQARNDDRQRVIDNIKAKDKKYEQMSADLQLAKEREKDLMEEIGSKDEEIHELKQSVRHWKKMAESGSQGGEKHVEQMSQVRRE